MGSICVGLGGGDSSPMMSYKYVVSNVTSRPEFLREFYRVRNGKFEIKTGNIIDDIKEEHLLDI